MDNLYEIAEALRMVVLELKGLREDMKAQSGVTVELDGDWYNRVNNLVGGCFPISVDGFQTKCKQGGMV